MAREPNETNAQYSRRLMEQHKEAIERLSEQGYTKEEKRFDDILARALGEKPKEVPMLFKLIDINKMF